MPSVHMLTARGAHEGETDETRLPAPEEPLLSRLDEAQLAELIGHYLGYVDEKGRSVHLSSLFAIAGQRSSGKTTVINMCSMAVFGCCAAASAWSSTKKNDAKPCLPTLVKASLF